MPRYKDGSYTYYNLDGSKYLNHSDGYSRYTRKGSRKDY